MALRTGDLLMQQFKKWDKWQQLDNERLSRLKEVMLEIADDFVDCCEKNNLDYYMAFGTALGAVRHKGFIPWDDDIDFYMPRKDFDRFLEIAENYIGEKYYIRSVSNGAQMGVITIHIRRKGTYYVNYGDLVITKDEPEDTKGIYIDIFPLEDASNFKILRTIKGSVCLFLQLIASCITLKESLDILKKEGVKIEDSAMKHMRLKYYLGWLFGIISLRKWTLMCDWFERSKGNDKSKYITCYIGYKSLVKSCYLRSDIIGNCEGEFEGRKWRLPVKYDNYLKQVYGDYMMLPDEEHRKIHPIFDLKF